MSGKISKFPLISRKKSYWSSFSDNKKCPICHKIYDGNGKFVCLSGGALKGDEKTAQISSDLVGFLSLSLHDHDNIGKSGYLPIVENSQDGQFEFYLCSIDCLRKFLMQVVDKFEKN